MIKQQILAYFNQQKNDFNINFEPAFTFNKQEAIHDMRVSIKRLRLLYRFLDFFADKQFGANKKAKLLLVAFKSAGPLRDAQIQQSILENNKNNLQSDYSEFASFLLLKEETGIIQFKEIANALDFIKIAQIFSLTEALLNTIVDFPNLQAVFNNYKKNRYLSIQNLINEKKSEIDYHRVRKRIKDLAYLTEIQQTKLNIANNELILLKQLGTKLGDWHDLKVFLSELKLFKDRKQKKLAFYTEIENELKQKQQVIIDEFYLEYKQLL